MAKIILDLCGGVGAWSQPYVEAGYDVRLVTMPDIDVRLYKPPVNVHGVLAAPPCTKFSTAAAQYWKKWGNQVLIDALSVVDACLRIIIISKPKWWCLENPPGRLRRYLGKPTMLFQPYEYGDDYTKKTLLWGDFCPPGKWYPIKPIKPIHKRKGVDDYHLRNKCVIKRGERSKYRSITPPGFARAFFKANP